MVAQEPAGGGGVAAAVPARPVELRLGLSAATITRLTTQWQDEARAFNNRSLAGTDYVYCWVDGIHLKVRLEADKVLPARRHRGEVGRTQGAHLVALVRAGATFVNGKLVERPNQDQEPDQEGGRQAA